MRSGDKERMVMEGRARERREMKRKKAGRREKEKKDDWGHEAVYSPSQILQKRAKKGDQGKEKLEQEEGKRTVDLIFCRVQLHSVVDLQ